ncbi:MAG: hypothetical protein WDA27_03805 [Actinomycetota bacterium]
MPERKKPLKPVPARAAAKKPVPKKPAPKKPAAAAKKPVPKKSAAAAKKPVPKKPAAAAKKPVPKKSAAAVGKPAAAAKKSTPAPRKPAAVVEKPAAEKPAAEKPAARESRAPAVGAASVSSTRPVAVAPGARESIATPYVYRLPVAEPQDSSDVPDDSTPAPDAPSALDGAPPRTWEEPAAAALAGVLAILVLVPWYSAGSLSVSGWASGTWGPVVFFLALAAVGVIALRRLNAPVRFPVESGLVVEAVAWVSIVGLFIKRFMRVKAGATGFTLGVTRGQTIALFVAVGLALVAGRLSTNAPIMIRPGWFRDREGKIGVAILGVALAVGLIFGFTNSAFPGQPQSQAGAVNPNVRQVTGMPKCGKDMRFPVPAGVTATSGYDIKGSPTCVMTFSSSSLTLSKMYSRFVAALRKAGWSVTSSPALQTTRVLSLTKPKCGQMTFIEGQSGATSATASPKASPAKKVRTATVWVGPCASPAPSR